MKSQMERVLELEKWESNRPMPGKAAPGAMEARRGCKSFQISADNLFKANEEIIFRLHPKGTSHAPIQHCHDFYEIPFVYRGKIYHQIEDSLLMQDSSHLLILNLDSMHNVWAQDNETILFNLLIRPVCMQTCILPLIRSNSLFYSFFNPFQKRREEKLHFLFLNLSEECANLLERMIYEFYLKDQYSQEILLSQCIQLFYQLARCQDESTSAAEEDPVIELLRYIRMNSGQITLEDAAKHFGYSTRHFSRILKAKTGQGFCAWVLEFKLDNACQLLKNTDLSVQEIMERSGFHSPSSFYKAFQEKTGMSAREYRSNCKKES